MRRFAISFATFFIAPLISSPGEVSADLDLSAIIRARPRHLHSIDYFFAANQLPTRIRN
jgi:hypothetical protein